MQQFESVRSRARSMSPRAQWVQLGLLSASVVAPLISRWNSLRALEYTQSLRDEAEQRIKLMRARPKRQGSEVLEQVLDLLRHTSDRSADLLPMPRSRASVSTRLWVIGATLGLTAAGAGTFIYVRRRLAQGNDEPLVDLALHSSNGHGNASGYNSNGRYSNGASAMNGTTPTARANAMPTPTPTPMPTPAAPSASTSTTGNASGRSETEAATPPSDSAADATGVVDADSAPFIGNIRTMVFHEADAANLPSEDNRVYFASEAEARSAGYRRDRDEMTTAEAEAEAQASE